ncbi:MAG: hypothetical protein ACE5DQ_00170 [Candidatus Paceibacterota bacterium]
MKNDGKKLLLVITVFALGILLINRAKYINPEREIEWIGFHYPNRKISTDKISEARALEQSPRFNTLQDCMKWVKDMISAGSNAGFECSYGCRIDEWGLICKDTTKMITTIKNKGLLK